MSAPANLARAVEVLQAELHGAIERAGTLAELDEITATCRPIFGADTRSRLEVRRGDLAVKALAAPLAMPLIGVLHDEARDAGPAATTRVWCGA